MNANDYCSAPPPTIPPPIRPIQSPHLQCISIRCPADEKSNQYWSAS